MSSRKVAGASSSHPTIREQDAPATFNSVAERVRQGGHYIPDDVIRRRFSAGRRNFDQVCKPAVDAWAKFDNVGESPILLEWGENS